MAGIISTPTREKEGRRKKESIYTGGVENIPAIPAIPARSVIDADEETALVVISPPAPCFPDPKRGFMSSMWLNATGGKTRRYERSARN